MHTKSGETESKKEMKKKKKKLRNMYYTYTYILVMTIKFGIIDERKMFSLSLYCLKER